VYARYWRDRMRVDRQIEGIERDAKREFLPILGPERGIFLERLVVDRRPCRIVEVGVLVGYAALRMARQLAPGCSLTGIEIDEEMLQRARRNVEEAGLDGQVRLLRGDALEVIGGLEDGIDFVMLDGQRSQYLAYLRALEPKLESGATVVASIDEGQAGAVSRYLDYVRGAERYRSEPYPFGGDALEVSCFLG